ncbi:MAG: hypothetical protein IJH37_08450 [Clostridia bacterium]|nr:hypothetical protein [Clostridia bacterium]
MVNKSTLSKLADELKSHGIIWGIGGSYLLQIYNLYDNPNDLDLWIHPQDMGKVKQIFGCHEKIETRINLPEQYHLKIKYYDAEVDFVACFIIKPNQNQFIYNITHNNIRKIQMDDGVKVPCTYLEDWYIIYKLLKREDKAQIIKDFFIKHKKRFDLKAIEESLNNPENRIPKGIRIDANDFIFSIRQVSIFDESDTDE